MLSARTAFRVFTEHFQHLTSSISATSSHCRYSRAAGPAPESTHSSSSSGQIHWILEAFFTEPVDPAPPLVGKMLRDAKLSSGLLEPPRGASLAGSQTVCESWNMRRRRTRLMEGVCSKSSALALGVVAQALWCVLLALADEAWLGGCSLCIVCSDSTEGQREIMLVVAMGAFSVPPSISVALRPKSFPADHVPTRFV